MWKVTKYLLFCLILFNQCTLKTKTKVEIEGNNWLINGEITYPGTQAEGLLMNVRMVNSTFEDAANPDFDSFGNTREFIDKIPEYKAAGVRAFTLNLQGGSPGYEGVVNSAFKPNGSLKSAYMDRVSHLIKVCDIQGMVIILGCFYQRQDQILRDSTAVKVGLVNVLEWISDNNFTNVVLEIANEYPHNGFNHEAIRATDQMLGLIEMVKEYNPNLLVSTSGLGNGKIHHDIAEASDFILLHFNDTKVNQIPSRIKALKKYGKPIVCNEDNKIGDEAVEAMKNTVSNSASWGYLNLELNQFVPLQFNGLADDSLVYNQMQKYTTE
ncbi:MAG: glycoside hydrolase family 5 protein [Flammeovirgaceae bacterium]|nr:glycoside hydrolase family 5 protein [Flammeovirgaceae bacterium]